MKKKYENLLSSILEDMLQQNPEGDSKITTIFSRDVVNLIKSEVPEGVFLFKCKELKETFVFDEQLHQDYKMIFDAEKHAPKEYYYKFFFLVFSYLYADKAEIVSRHFNKIVSLFILFNDCFNYNSIGDFFSLVLLHSMNTKNESFDCGTISNIVKFSLPYIEKNEIIFEVLIKIFIESKDDDQKLQEIGPAFYNINIDKLTSNNSLIEQFLNISFEGVQNGKEVCQNIIAQCFRVSSNPLLKTFSSKIAENKSKEKIEQLNFIQENNCYSKKYELNNNIPSKTTHSNNLTLDVDVMDYGSCYDYNNFLNPDLLNGLKNDCEKYLISAKKEIINVYIEEFVKTGNVIAVVYISSLCCSQITESIADLIIKSPIFSVTNSMFSNNPEFAAQHFIRQEAIEIISLGKYFNKLHTEYQNYPYLTAEFLARTIFLPSEYEIYLTPKEIEQRLAFFSYEFDKEQSEITHFCRFLYILLFSQLCLTKQNYFDSNSWYCLYSVLDIDIIRNTALRVSISYFSNKKFSLIESLCFIEKISNLILDQNSEEKSSTFLDIIINSSVAQHEFRSATKSLLKIAFDQVQCGFESVRKKVWRIIYILLRQTKYILSDDDNAQICKIFEKVSFKKGTLFFSGTVSSIMKNRSSQYIIPMPQLIPIYFFIAGRTGKYTEMLQSIDQLIGYSQLNTELLHKGRFDSIVLKLIESFPEPIIFKGCPIKNFESISYINTKVLPVLSKILLQSTSQEIAKESINSIFPLQKGNTSLASTLMHEISSLNKKKICQIPITKQQTILKYSPVMLHSFIQGSTIIFWIHVDKGMSVNAKKPDFTILKAFNGENPFINVFITKGELTLQIRQVTKMSMFVLSEEIPQGEWTQIAISIKGIPEKNQMIITSYKNNEDPSKSQVVLEEMEDAELSFVWGNDKEQKNIKDERMIYLGNLSVIGSDLTRAETDKMFDNGMIHPWFPDNIIFSYPEFKDFPTQIHNSLQLDTPIEAQHNSLNVMIDRSYDVNLLIYRFMEIKRDEVDYLLLIDAIFLLFPSHIEKAIIYFENIFETPSYRIYLRLFKNADLITEEQQKILFTKVLTNLKIWTRSCEKDQIKILYHISTSLYNTMYDYFLAPEFFREMVAQVQEFVPSYFDECLDLISKLLLKIARESKNGDNIIAILQACVSCKDPKLVVRFLNLATELFAFSPKNANYVKYLHSVDFSQHKQLLSPLLRALHSCSGDSFYTRTQVLSYQLPLSFTCELLKDDVAQFPVLYSIAITIALKAEKEQRRSVISTICQFSKKPEKRSLIRSLEFWMLWPAVFVLQTDDREQMDMLSFIANVLLQDYNIDDLDMVMSVLDLLGLRTNISPLIAKSVLLKLVADSLLIKNNVESFAGIINRCLPTFFFSWEYSSYCNSILNEFSGSPFVDSISSIMIRKPSYVRTYQDLKTFKFDSSKTFLRFSISQRENMNFLLSNAIDSVQNILVSVNQKQIPNIQFLKTVINYMKEKDENKIEMEKTFLDKIEKIESDIKSQFGPTLQITAMRLNAFVQSLDNQLHGISKKFILDTNDLGKLQSDVKQSMNIYNFEIELAKHNVGLNDPEFRLDNFISSTLIANRLKRNWPKDPRAQVTRTKFDLPIKALTVRIKQNEKESVELYINNEELIINGDKSICIERKSISDAFQTSNHLYIITTKGRGYLFEMSKELSSQILGELQITPSVPGKSFVAGKYGTIEIITRTNLYLGSSFELPEKYPLFPWPIFTEGKLSIEFNDNLMRLPFSFDATDPHKTVSEQGNITQQFLFVPELYRDVKLPEGFSTVFDYSSHILTLIKSREGSNYVANWLERLMNRQFGAALPFITKRKFHCLPMREIKFSPGGARRAFFTQSNSLTSLVVIVRKDGSIGITSVTGDKSEIVRHTLPKMGDCIPIKRGGILYLYCRQNQTLYNVTEQSIVSQNFLKVTASCVGFETIVATEDGMLHFLSDSLESVSEDPFPFGEATIIATNASYNCFAVACKDGYIRFCSLRNHKLISSFDIKMQPENVEPIEELGFVIHSGNYLFIFTVNGIFVRKYKFERRICAISISLGSTSINALIFAIDEVGQLHAIDPLSQEPFMDIASIGSFPIGISSDLIGSSIIAATETGAVRLTL